MDAIEISRSGFFYKIWEMTYGYSREPKDICTYRSQLLLSILLSIILLPITIWRLIWMYIINKYFNTNWIIPGVVGYVIPLLVILISLASGTFLQNEDEYLWYYPIAGLVGTSIIIILYGAMIYSIIEYIPNAYKKYKGIKKYPKDNTIILMYKSWRDKYCTPLKWKN